MNEAVFPLLGPLLVLAIALPVASLVAASLLLALRPFEDGLFRASNDLRYVLVIASSALPLGWFVSASLHQAESGASAVVCIADHPPGADCVEPVHFSLVLLALAAALALPRLFRDQRLLRPSASAQARAVSHRVSQLVAERPNLAALRGRIIVSERGPAIATLGVLSARVVLQPAFADRLDDESLAAALHHELEHIKGRDPLRYFLAWCALAVNPIGRWLLRAEHARWLLGRELQCDREAVLAGGSAAGLAQALVAAARPVRTSVPMLASQQLEALRLRVQWLLSYAERAPARYSHAPTLRLASVLLLVSVSLPHIAGTKVLDVIHVVSESAVAIFAG